MVPPMRMVRAHRNHRNPTGVSDNNAAHQARWDRDDPAGRPDTAAHKAHHDRARATLTAQHQLPWDTALPPSRTEAARARHITIINQARQALSDAAYQLLEGGTLRDGADPTAVAAVLYIAARRLALSPQWADRVRPPLGRHNPAFPGGCANPLGRRTMGAEGPGDVEAPPARDQHRQTRSR